MKIIGIGQARKSSSRCKNKMLRQFGETSLVEIAVKRIANLTALDNAYFGAYDEKKGSLESVMKIYNQRNFFVPEFYGGINESECSLLLKNFFRDQR